MTVYVVSRPFEGAIGVFSSKTRALKHAASTTCPEDTWIEEFDVDVEYEVDFEEDEE